MKKRIPYKRRNPSIDCQGFCEGNRQVGTLLPVMQLVFQLQPASSFLLATTSLRNGILTWRLCKLTLMAVCPFDSIQCVWGLLPSGLSVGALQRQKPTARPHVSTVGRNTLLATGRNLEQDQAHKQEPHCKKPAVGGQRKSGTLCFPFVCRDFQQTPLHDWCPSAARVASLVLLKSRAIKRAF